MCPPGIKFRTVWRRLNEFTPDAVAAWIERMLPVRIGWLLEFNVLATSKVISGRALIYEKARLCLFYSAAAIGNSCCWYHDLISHSVTLSSHWANQSLSCPLYAERQARKWQISSLQVIGFTRLETQLPMSYMRGTRSTDPITVPGFLCDRSGLWNLARSNQRLTKLILVTTQPGAQH